ncbi:phospholipase B-like protein, partial [Kipferlia bialata]
YIPSINTPASNIMRNVTGETWKGQADPYWSYDNSSRYHIFARDMPNVMNFEDFKQFTRYNGYLINDPFSNEDPGQSIASRYDQRTVCERAPSPFGAIDSKCSRKELALNLQFDCVAGPTTDNGLPVWSFDEWTAKHGEVLVHEGIPDTVHFDWTTFAL